jgi:hypothetical protein
MKKMSTVLILLLIVPLFAFAAPKKKVTIPILKQRVAVLLSENKALKAEIALLKAQKPPVCTSSAPIINNIVQREIITQVKQPMQTVTIQNEVKREVKFNASVITDNVEVKGLKSATGITFQVMNLQDGDTVDVSGTTITSQVSSGSVITYELPLTATNITVTINGTAHPVEIIVKDSPDFGSNSNKHIYVSPATQFVTI